MGTHPNALLIAELTPDDLARKTFREIQQQFGKPSDAGYVRIGDDDFHLIIMESNYHDGYQLSSEEGRIVLMDMVTYGYGETIDWDALSEKREALASKCREIATACQCTFNGIKIGANYW